MALREDWTEWHLTPSGWIPGTTVVHYERFDQAPPPDRVLSYRYIEIYMLNTFAPSSRRLDLIWEDNAPEHRAAFLLQYGTCPQCLHVVRFAAGATDARPSLHR